MKFYIFISIFFACQFAFTQSDKQRINTVLRTNKLTSSAYYVEIDYPRNLPGMIARYRADSLQTIIDTQYSSVDSQGVYNGSDASQSNFNGTVFQWKDISYKDTNGDGVPDTPNNNHLVAHDKYRASISTAASATYIENTATNPSYRTNASVSGDGLNDHLYKDINPNLSDDFTFIFVMRATNPNPTSFNSFIASSSGTKVTNPSGSSITGSWQLSTNSNVANFYFGYHNSTQTIWLNVIPFDTQTHVFYLQYDNINKNLRIEVDGVLKVNHTVPSGKSAPIIDELRLYRNRNLNTYIAAEFNEFFLAERVFTESEKRKVTNYLLAKWGVNY